MSFSSRNEFISAQASEKITLAHVEGVTRLVNWTVHSGNIYKKTVPYYVVGVKQGTAALTEVASPTLAESQWYYDPAAGVLYVYATGGGDPGLVELAVTYRLFYADAPVTLSYDLSNTGTHVQYDGRILQSPGYSHKIGVDQGLVSTTGSGTLKLQNTDGALDSLFDTIFFENQAVRIYSWNRDLAFDASQIIFRGKITNKKFTRDFMELRIKDAIYDLAQNIPQTAYSDSDTVTSEIKGRYKRWIYGRVDGLQLQSLDQIGDGYAISGTVSATTSGPTLTGSGTSFLSQVSPDDTIKIETQEFTIESVETNTSLTLSGIPDFGFGGKTALLVPKIPTTGKNRAFLVADHACARLQTTVTEIVQLNRIRVADASGYEAGDKVTFTTGETIEIRKVAPGNLLVLWQNVIVVPSISSTVTREPVQEIYINGVKVLDSNYTLSNVGSPTNETKVTLSGTAEFNIAPTVLSGFSATFTNGLRSVTTSGQPDLRDIIQPRDWIRPTDPTYTTYYEVLSVDETTITLRAAFGDPTHTGTVEHKRPDYVGDDTIVSANTLGRTVNGEPSGTWISTSADAVKDVLAELNITDVNASSFTQGASDSPATISLALPLTPSGGAVTGKAVIDILAKTANAAVTLDNDLFVSFRVLQPEIDGTEVTIRDEDLINWSIETSNGKTIRNSLVRYRHQDIDRNTLASGSSAISYTSSFVETYIGTNLSDEIDMYVYETDSATIAAHRAVYYRSLGRADIQIESDLRLEGVEIGDTVVLDIARMFTRLGDSSSTKKVCIVVGKTVTGQRIKFALSDLGNIYNRSSIITPNAAPDFTSATEDEKLSYGYITTAEGTINSQDDTANTHLIS